MSTTTVPVVPEAIHGALADALQHELRTLLSEHVATAHALHAERGHMDASSIRGRELALAGSLTTIGSKLAELRRLNDAVEWIATNAPALDH